VQVLGRIKLVRCTPSPVALTVPPNVALWLDTVNVGRVAWNR
jgi:hypothetical protein